VTDRRRLSTTKRLALFQDKKGICHMCKMPIKVGEAWDHSHVIPLALGGADDESNWDIAHKKCHRTHTSEVDIPTIAQAERREAVHVGAKQPSGSFRKEKKEKLPLRVAAGKSQIARRYGL
jgi:5-methylcytosine-specific restriction protein A